MIHETMIDAEREESDEAHDLKLLNVLMKCIEEAIEDDEWDYDNMTMFFCVIPPILMLL